ncbi:interferon tau-2-like [Peromyscus eremicus]|uniref:interferon tau-2-like n=2 Tax=Peromyscus eremicus TaxID=42410 RepID=UPI0027DC6DC7|nr:interferon tau-2-like [Peromyscus eremicus]
MVPGLPLLLGVMLGCSTACSLDRGASWRLHLQSRESARLLGQLKSLPGHQCLQDRMDFRCPWKKGRITQGKQKEDATCCHSEMLRQLLQLFGTEASRDAWAERPLGQLVTSLLSGLEALEGRAAEPSPSCAPPLAMAIRTYFLGISRYLEGKGYSPCSWEIVRAEMQVALSTFPVPAERSPKKRRRSMEESPLLR